MTWGALISVVLALAPPAPNAAIPGDPARLAPRLTTTETALHDAVGRWNGSGRSPPRDVTLYALYEQRIVLRLRADDRLARSTLARVPARLRRELRSELTAQRELARLTTPRPLRAIRIGRPEPAGALKRYYLEAQRRFGVSWQLLAAVNYVESAFGKVRSPSSAGAQGPMQFLPATWRVYGLGGDVHDAHDAILGAANYLRANGAPRDVRRALYRYNPSSLYVDAILRRARAIRADPRAFLVYYSRQVFVRTPSGLRRVSGPGPR
jgi:soluble lytic murein transglycosylase-like protein